MASDPAPGSPAAAAVELGRCWLSPDAPVTAGQWGTWTITYTAGRAGIAPGGGLAVLPPRTHGTRWRVGHVVAITNGAGGVRVDVRNAYPLRYHHAQYPVIFVTVEGAALQPGGEIRVTLGDPGAFVSGFYERARVQELAQRGATFQVLVDPLGNASYSNPAYPGGQPRGYRLLPDLPRIDVLPAGPRRLTVVAPARIAAGEIVRVLVAAHDEYGNRCEEVEGLVEMGLISLPSASAGLYAACLAAGHAVQPSRHAARSVGPRTPWSGRAAGGGEGLLAAGAVRATLTLPDGLAGPFSVTAACWEWELAGVSNPIEVVPAGTDRIYFGDLHTHAPDALGDPPKPETPFAAFGTGTFEQAYTYARDVAGLDFVALAWFPPPEGVENLWQPSRPDDWAGYQVLTRRFHEPGRFVPFEAVELNDPPNGHRVVIFPGDGSPRLRNDALDDLWPALEGTGALVVPHHTNATSEGGPQAWRAQNWRKHHPGYQRVAEITQNRGAFETDTPGGATVIGGHGASLQDALALGCHIGFAGGTDSHHGRPGSSSCPMAGVDPHDHVTGGLTAVFAPELTRQAIHAALKARRCYATTGARLLLDFQVDGQPMGSEMERSAGKVTVTARVVGTAPLARLEVISGGDVVYAQVGGGRVAELRCALPVPAGETRYFYLRVTQTDGQTAWSSPVWVTASAPAG